jgi:hypothetical protein
MRRPSVRRMTKHFSRTAVGIGLIGAPLLTLVSSIASPAIKSDNADQLAVIAQHPDRYYLFSIFAFAGIALLIPAILGLMQMTSERAPRWGNVGGALSLVGVVVAAGDALSQLIIWQMAAPGADRAQMVALLKRYDEAAGSTLPFTIGGLALLAGCVMLAIGLRRARAVPVWVAVGFPVGIFMNIAGFTGASVALLVASSVVLLASLGWVGWRMLTTAGYSRAFASGPARAW